MKKFLFAALSTAAIIASQMSISHAGNGFSGGIAIGEPYPERYPDYRERPRDWWDEDDDEYEAITCREGRRIVRNEGFRRVEPVKCHGNVYRYRAIRRDRLWSVRVNAWTGRIVSARIEGYR